MKFNMLTRRSSDAEVHGGVYADLDDLLRLQAKGTGFSFLPRQPIHSILSRRHSSRLRGRGLNFEETRAYLPGDDIRNMDWKVTARMRKPHVRVFTEERDRAVLLVVDQRMSMFFGSRRCMKSVTAAEAAALGAWRVRSDGDRVGALVFDDTEIKEISPHRSRDRVVEILSTIVDFNHRLNARRAVKSNPEMLSRVLERARRLATHDCLVAIISDASGADEDTVRHVTTLTEHNDVLAVFVFDPMEQELPAAGRIVVTEDDRQLQVDTTDRGLRKRYKADFEKRMDWLKNVSRLRQIPLLPISTAEDTASQVQRALGYHPKVAP